MTWGQRWLRISPGSMSVSLHAALLILRFPYEPICAACQLKTPLTNDTEGCSPFRFIPWLHFIWRHSFGPCVALSSSQSFQLSVTIKKKKKKKIISFIISPAKGFSKWWREEKWNQIPLTKTQTLNLWPLERNLPRFCVAQGCCAGSSVKPNSQSFCGIKTACSVPRCLHFLCLNVKSYSAVDLINDWVIFKPLDVFQSLYFTLD